MPNIFEWTHDKVEELERLWKDGETCTTIGNAIGTSRNSVIGKVHRLGLSGRAQRMNPEQQEQKRKARNASRINRQRISRQTYGAPKMQHTPAQPLPPFVGSLNIPFADLRDFKNGEPNQCLFIADNPPGPQYLACGNETLPGESWCGHHKNIVFSRNQVTQAVSQQEQDRRIAMFKKGGRLPTLLGVAGADILSDEAA